MINFETGLAENGGSAEVTADGTYDSGYTSSNGVYDAVEEAFFEITPQKVNTGI